MEPQSLNPKISVCPSSLRRASPDHSTHTPSSLDDERNTKTLSELDPNIVQSESFGIQNALGQGRDDRRELGRTCWRIQKPCERGYSNFWHHT